MTPIPSPKTETPTILYRRSTHKCFYRVSQFHLRKEDTNQMPYSGPIAYLNARIPIELLERLDSKAQEFDLTRSMLIRSILEMMFLTPDEIQSRVDKERAIAALVKRATPNAGASRS